MGKRKKATNVVKIDLGDIFKKEEALPVLVQHSSKDRRRIERTVHSIPVLQPSQPPQPPQPNPLSFDPCPMVAEYEDDVFIDTELHDEGNDGDRVRSRFPPLFRIFDGCGVCSGIHYRRGARIATTILKTSCYWKGVWSSATVNVIFVQILVRPLLSTRRVCLTSPPGSYRCLDCADGFLCCDGCIVRIHVFSPYHRVQVCLLVGCKRFRSIHALLTHSQQWTGAFFKKSSLRKAGLSVQLGHHTGDVCTNPNARAFTVIHRTGIHVVDMRFCGCSQASKYGNHVQQLMRRRLFPATTMNPQTAATFAFLEYAQILSVQSKLSLYDYYISIEILTDATHTSGVKVCTLMALKLTV